MDGSESKSFSSALSHYDALFWVTLSPANIAKLISKMCFSNIDFGQCVVGGVLENTHTHTPPFRDDNICHKAKTASTVVGDYHFDSCFSLRFCFSSLGCILGLDLCIFKRFTYCFCAQIWPSISVSARYNPLVSPCRVICWFIARLPLQASSLSSTSFRFLSGHARRLSAPTIRFHYHYPAGIVLSLVCHARCVCLSFRTLQRLGFLGAAFKMWKLNWKRAEALNALVSTASNPPKPPRPQMSFCPSHFVLCVWRHMRICNLSTSWSEVGRSPLATQKVPGQVASGKQAGHN